MSHNVSHERSHKFITPVDSYFFKPGVVLLFIAIFTLSSLENLLLIVAVCQPRIRQRANGKYSRYLVGNMSLANLLFTTITVPFTIHFFITDKRFLKDAYAQACGFFVELLTSGMIASILVITVERLLAVIYPLQYRRCANKPCILCLSIVGWAISALIATVPFIGFLFIEAEPFTFSESFSIFFLVSCSSHIFYRCYTIIFCFTSYVIPLTFIIIAYSIMYRSVLHISRDLQTRSRKEKITVDTGPRERQENLNHSMSSPNFPIDNGGSFFSSKKLLLEVDENPELKRFRKISANSFFRSSNKADHAAPKYLSRCHSENHNKRSPTSTNSSKESFIRKGSKMCSKKIKRIFRQKEEIHAAKTCLVVVATFVILISPYFILLTIQAFHTEFMEHNIIWNTLSVALLYVNCIVTPAIYVYRDLVVLYEVQHLWNTCSLRKDLIPIRANSVRSRTAMNNGGKTNIEVILELEEKHFTLDKHFSHDVLPDRHA